MNKFSLSLAIAAVCFAGASTSVISGNYYHHHNLVTYDDFDGDYLDPDKWTPRRIDGGALDVTRKTGDHAAHLGIRAYADTDFTGICDDLPQHVGPAGWGG